MMGVGFQEKSGKGKLGRAGLAWAGALFEFVDLVGLVRSSAFEQRRCRLLLTLVVDPVMHGSKSEGSGHTYERHDHHLAENYH